MFVLTNQKINLFFLIFSNRSYKNEEHNQQ